MCTGLFVYCREKLGPAYSLSADQFSLLAPYHVVFDSNFEILQMSDNMTQSSSDKQMRKKRANSMDSSIGTILSDVFRISAAGIEGISDMDWDAFHTAALVTTEKQHSFFFEANNAFTKSGKPHSYVGKILFLKNEFGVDHAAVFLCSPNVDTVEEMYDQGVSIKDLKNKDDSRMQMLLNQANVTHLQASSSKVCVCVLSISIVSI